MRASFQTIPKALLAAGLSLFLATQPAWASSADDEDSDFGGDSQAAVRSIAKPMPRPSPTPTSTPEVRGEEFRALQEETRLLKAKLTEERASNDTLTEQVKEQARLLDVEKFKLESRNSELEELQKKFAKQEEELGTLLDKLQATQKNLHEVSKDLSEFEGEFKDKKDQLYGILDLVSELKKDINDNSMEIVEVKHSMNELKARLDNPGSSQDFWDKAMHWEYLPATAVGISILSVFLALHK